MNTDTISIILRYVLMTGGGFLVSQGRLTADDLNQLVGAILVIVPIAWGIYVRWGTKAVPAETAARADVPTVSAATGVVKR